MITDRSAKPPVARTVWENLPPQPCVSHGAFPWYVVQTAPFRESKVRDALDAQGFGTFVPIISEERVKRRFRWGRYFEERRRKTVPCFPGYLFVAFDVRAPEWRTIHKVNGVERIISAGPERPIAVPADAMQVLLDLGYDRVMVKETAEANLVPRGATVRVTSGPFANFEGVCLWSKKDRIRLLMSVFGRQSEIEVSPGNITLDR